jgi:hypothetical protein
MSPSGSAFCATILALVLPAGYVRAQASDDAMVIVLANGAVLHGRISNTSGGLSIRNERGSVATLRFDQIAVLADSIDAAYRELTKEVDFGKPDEIARWFDWALGNGLPDRAAELLALAETHRLDPFALQHMKTRLESAAFDPPQEAPAESAAPIAKTDLRPSRDDIDQAIQSLPDGMKAFFNQQLHSKLLIGCSAARCHDRQHQAMSFWHDGLGRVNPRGFTRHNLHQVLQWIDRDEPGRSRLLEMAQTAHGGQDKPAFESSDEAFLLLQYWSYAVSRVPQRYLTEVAGMAVQPVGEPSASASVASEEESRTIAPVGFVDIPAIPQVPETQGSDSAESGVLPVDPCDPAIFNAQFHPNRAR